MQAKKRYILVFISCAFLAYCYFGGYRLKGDHNHHHHDYNDDNDNNLNSNFNSHNENNNRIRHNHHHYQYYSHNKKQIKFPKNPNELPSFLDIKDRFRNNLLEISSILIENGLTSLSGINFETSGSGAVHNQNHKHNNLQLEQVQPQPQPQPQPQLQSLQQQKHQNGRINGAGDTNSVNNYNYNYNNHNINKIKSCRMETCFDYTKCFDQFLVYVYPLEPLNSLGAAPPISSNYQKILTAIRESRYYTSDPDKACLYVLGIDTLDRDSLSEDYVRNVPSRLQRLSHWNNGRNHIIFNLYSGTWPDYIENSLGFDPGEAILAKASMSIQQIRYGFDISIPLFHKQFPLRAGNTGFVQTNNFPANKKYLLAFKGKR